MKQLRLFICILCLSTATLVVLVSHGIIEIAEVWQNMISGNVFSTSLYLFEWLFILFIIVLVWLINFNSQEVRLLDNWYASCLNLLIKRKNNPHLNLVSSGSIPVFGKVQPLDEQEILAFRQMIEVENGPSILLNDDWKQELEQAVIERDKNADMDLKIPAKETETWLVMDLEEASGTAIPKNKNPLNQDISMLLTEQEHLVFNMLDIRNQDEEENFIPPSLKVVYRSKENTRPSIAESLKNAWESKENIAFYRKLIEACDQ